MISRRAPSQRQIAAQKVYDITRRLPPEILTVGVFRDEHPSRVIELANRSGVKAVQLHGRETPEQAIPQPVSPEPLLSGLDALARAKALISVDDEGELAVVIGRRVRNISSEDALAAVFGYAVIDDVSARDLQRTEGNWVRAKGGDTFGPFGPWITTADEVPDPQALTIRTWVNGEQRQEGRTADMIFSVAELVEFCSRHFTLEPGDVIATGTPSGGM